MLIVQCTKCEEWKAIDAFPKHPDCLYGRDTSRCLLCKNKASRESYRNSSREKKILNRAKSRATKRGIPFSINENDITVPDVCPVFGTPLDGDQSIDRFEPDKGYIPGNVNVISLRANVVKGNATLEELEAVVAWMKSKK